MHTKLWSRIGLIAAAILGAAAATGVTTAHAADPSDTVSDRTPAAWERVASSKLEVPLRDIVVAPGTDYFGPGDLVEEQVGTDGFSWG